MKRLAMTAALAAGLALLAGCGEGEPGAPTAADNAQLNDAANMLEELPSDSLTASEDTTLGNGDAPSAETGDLLVADNGVTTGEATNQQ
jgi:hypothetical protein